MKPGQGGLMKHVEGTFKGIKKTDLSYQAWLPDNEPKAILLVVHGLAEHIGRYMNLVNYFVPRGYGIYGFDLRGHGKSPGQQSYVDRFNDYVEDTRAFFELVRDQNNSRKIFMVGHSMGGLIAAAYAIKYQEGLSGLVSSAALLKIGESVSPVTAVLAKILSSVIPRMGITVLDATTISRDKAVVDAYVNDPLVFRGKTSARLGAELLDTIAMVSRHAGEINLPIMVIFGSDDKLVNPGGSRMLFQNVGSQDKTLKVYEGFFHEIFNEAEHEKVMADVEAWLLTHI
jgi:acylglycerol lipase